MRILFFIILFSSINLFAEAPSGKEKVVYKYKKYEKFDFDELSVTGEGGAPGDLSVTPRYKREFKNKLPLRKNFTPEIRKSIERVQ